MSDDIVNSYNKIRSYLSSCMKIIPQNKDIFYQKLPTCPDGYVEKSEIKWFELNEIISNTAMFRNEFLNSLIKIINLNIITLKNN